MADIDIVDSEGIQTKDYETVRTELENGFTATYAADGDEVDFSSETPDGQIINIFAQANADIRELAVEVYNSFDPAKCTGVIQDSRYALNYLTRYGATFTVQNIDITVNKTVTLQGLDDRYNDINASSYTVSDDAGNLWFLIDTTTLTTGTTSCPFRSKNYGAFQSVVGTIVNQVTTVLGVTAINNSVAATSLGEEQESDAEFMLRRDRSTAIRGQNNTDAMLGQLLELDGVTDADVWSNRNNTTDDTGTAANTVWVIVDGGANTEIADVIYSNAGNSNFRGSVTKNVTSVAGQTFPVKFDRPNPVALYLKFDFQLYVDSSAVDVTGIKEYIAENLTYELNETAETSKPTAVASDAISANGGGGYALNMEISTDGSTWTDYIVSSSRKNKFVIDTSRITVNLIDEDGNPV